MKTTVKRILFFLLITTTIIACKKDDDNRNPNPNPGNTDPCANTTLALTATGGEDKITATASGGKTPYKYSISTDSANYVSGNEFTGLAAGSYTVYVKDSLGCVKSASATVPPPATTFTDSRDNTVYKIVKVGTQTWMAENLNYEVTKTANDSSFCYELKEDSCVKYGKLYTIGAAKNACPAGWHLPSEAEFNTLVSYLDNEGGEPTKTKLLEGGSAGFNARYSGWYSGTIFERIGERTAFWSTSEGTNSHKVLFIRESSATVSTSGVFPNSTSVSVRCIKD